MKKILLSILCLLSMVVAYGQTIEGDTWWNTDYNTTEGTEFWVTFMRNAGAGVGDIKDMKLYLYATAKNNSSIKVFNPNIPDTPISFEVEGGKQTSVEIPNEWAYSETPGVVCNSGLKIVSSAPISLYATNYHTSPKYDATNVLPVQALSGENIVQTYSIDQYSTEFALVSPEDQIVQIHLVKTTINADTFSANYGKIIIDSFATCDTTIYMLSGQAFLYRSADKDTRSTSLSGTKICAEKPLAVFMGGQSATIPYSNPENHIFHQAFPADKWGKMFVVTPTYGMVSDLVRITAIKDGTIIKRNGIIVDTINKLETFQDTLKSVVVKLPKPASYSPTINIYETSNEVECFLYGTGRDYNHPLVYGEEDEDIKTSYGAPVLSLITPQELGMSHCVFATFASEASNMKHYVNIVCQTNAVSGMRLDNQDISSEFVKIPHLPTYSYVQKELVKGKDVNGGHRIQNIKSGINDVFTARVYGLGDRSGKPESYAYSAGSRATRSADMLINDKYIRKLKICVDDDPVKFTSIIRHEYDNVWWLFGGDPGRTVKIKGDSIVTHKFEFNGDDKNIPDYDTVSMIVKSHAQLCGNVIYYDTVKAVIQVCDTFNIYEIYDDRRNGENICIGDEFYIRKSKLVNNKWVTSKIPIKANLTDNQPYFGNKPFKLNTYYESVDNLTTIYGCDSTFHDRFIIRPTYDTIVYDTICVNQLPKMWYHKDSYHEDSILIDLPKDKKDKLKLTIGKPFHKEELDTTITLQTIYGCDSVVTLHLLILPIYEKREDKEVCQDSINTTYKSWSGHINASTGRVINNTHHLQYYVNGRWKDTTYISQRYPGHYQYRDSMNTTYLRCKNCADNGGCDSIFYLNLYVKDHVINRASRTLCDDSYIIWEGQIHMGAHCPEPESTLPKVRYTTSYVHLVSQHESTQPGHCDSTFTMDITFCKSYPTPKDDIYHICENETHKFVDGKTYSWKTINHQVGRYVLDDTILTTKKCIGGSGCDSAVRHIVYVHPVYRDTTDTAVCAVPDGYFQWPTHTVSDSVWDVNKKVRIAMNEIPISVKGDFTYIDSLKTITCTNCENGIGCDSVWVLKLKVNPTYYFEDSSHICDSKSFTWEKHKCGHAQDTTLTNLSAGKYILWDSLQTVAGCDSIYKYILYVDSTYKRYDTITICDNEFQQWGKQDTIYAGDKSGLTKKAKTVILPAGIYDRDYHYQSTFGCDSAIYLHLIINKTYKMPKEDSVVCQDESFVWVGHSGHTLYDEDGEVVTISTAVDGIYTYIDSLTTKNGCDSIHTLRLVVHPTYPESRKITVTETICQSQVPFIWKGHQDLSTPSGWKEFSESGTYTDMLETKAGCDSLVELQLTIIKDQDIIIYDTICGNSTYEFHGKVYDAEKIQHKDTVLSYTINVGTCSYVEKVYLHIIPIFEEIDPQRTCQSDVSYLWNGHNKTGHKIWSVQQQKWINASSINVRYTGTYEYIDSLTSTASGKYGCDSIWKLQLIVDSVYNIKEDVTICEGESFRWEAGDTIVKGKATPRTTDLPLGAIKYESEQYVKRFQSKYRCDSTHTLNLIVKPKVYEHLTEKHSTADESIVWNGQTIVFDHVYTKTFADSSHKSIQYGCDSLVELTVIVDSAYVIKEYGDTCLNEPYVWKGHDTVHINTSQVGTKAYYDRLKTVAGTDSVHVLYFTVHPIYQYDKEACICDNESFLWQDTLYVGKNYEGTKPTDGKWRQLSQSSYLVNNYHTQFGCDSIYTLSLTIHSTHLTVRSTDTTYIHICENEPYLFASKNIWYNTHGEWKTENYQIGRHVLTDTIPTSIKCDNQSGCDSAIAHVVFVHPTYVQTESLKACQDPTNAYDWVGHNSTQYYWEEGHQWVSAISLQHIGDYTFIDSLHTKTCTQCLNNVGCDSVWILKLHVDTVHHVTQNAITCELALPYLWEGHVDKHGETLSFNKTGDYLDTIPNVFGCDSIVTLHLEVVDNSDRKIAKTVCNNDPAFTIGANNWLVNPKDSLPGTYYIEQIIPINSLCSYREIITLMINPVYLDSLTIDTVCKADGQYYPWDKHTERQLWDVTNSKRIQPNKIPIGKAGIYKYIDSTQTIAGCDSIWTLILYVGERYDFPTEHEMCDYDSYEWRDTLYYGEHYQGELPSNGKSMLIRKDSNFVQTYPTMFHCDSTYRLHIQVWPSYTKTESATTCESDDHTYVWHQQDSYGSYEQVITYAPIVAKDPEGKIKETLHVEKTDTLQTIHGCDSVITLALDVYPSYFFDSTKMIGSNIDITWQGRIIHGADYKGITEPVVFWDSTSGTIHGCDSIYKLTLVVSPSYHFYDTVQMCSDGEYHWQHLPAIDTTFYGLDILPNGVRVGTHIYRDTLKTIMGCDSIFELILTVDSAYLKVGKHDTTRVDICANETYHFKSLSKDTIINNNGDLARPDKSVNIYIIEGMDTTIHGCDSVVCHKVFIHPIYDFTQKNYICQDTINKQWEWKDDQGGLHGMYPRDKVGVFQLVDSQYTKQGCDSIFGVELHVMPIYRFDTTLYICENDSVSWQDVLFVGSQFAAYGKTYDASLYDSVRTNMSAGEYSSVVRHYTATYDCDSTYLAKIVVSKVYRTTIERRTCQTDAGYYYEHLNRGTGGLLPARYLSDSLTRNDTVPSVTGCDSIITLHYYVDSVYDYRQKVAVCQDTVNTQWEWIDEDGISHGFISIADSGNYSYKQKYKTIHGCDSIYGIQIRVKPIYRFDSTYVICENERISWQHKWYAGDSATAEVGDSILPPGLYYDTVHYITIEECDSTYYLQLRVNPIYDTLTKAMTCENEGFTWYQSDIYGSYADIIYPASSYHTFWITSDSASNNNPKVHLDTTMRHCDRMLRTIHNCDSMSHLELVINPAYMFITDTTICSNVVIKYRGEFFRGQDTTYFDRLQTTEGCDSIYQLRLHVRPIFISHLNRVLCDNDTLYHVSKNGMEVVWKPGDEIKDPEYEFSDMKYEDMNGCDSIYRYHLTIHPTFFHADSDTICTNVSYMFHDARDISPLYEYSVNEYILPFDTIFKDSLSTVHGCDSVYWLYAHIRPAYRDIQIATICDNETYQWRSHTIGQGLDLYQFNGMGDYTFMDSLVTLDGCDSIYELRLHVNPTFFTRYDETICADEVYAFNGLELNTSGFYYDSLTTISGCDSVYHLYLTVLDTTYEIRYDTVCFGDTVFLSHDTILQSGFYKDTTQNEWDCHHFLYLYLTYIEPSVPYIVADSMCLDHDAFEIEFAYTGTKPVAYSLYFDDFGHSQGFEDMVDYPIEPQFWDDEERYSLVVRTPWRDGDSTKYPRPDYYPIRLVLDNGYCQHLTKYLVDTIVMNYPSWVTQQRFRDVIAILSTKYNGGYEFSKFQWYRNNEPMPGETHEYLYLPQELEVDTTWYHVRLTRVGETESFQTCPINIFYDPIDTIAPIYSYLSVVPTCVDASNPVVNILCHYEGEYEIYDINVCHIKSGFFYPGAHDAFELDLSDLVMNSWYIVKLHSENTVKEPDRSIRIFIDGSNCACHPK